MKIFAINYQELHQDLILGTRQIDGQFRVPRATQKEALAAFRQAQKDGGIEKNATILGISEEQVPSRVFVMDFDVHPQSWERAGHGGHFYTKEATRAFEDELKMLMRSQMDGDPATTGCTVSLSLSFACKSKKKWGTPKTTRSDIDNLQKGIFDAGNGIVWEDDALIWRLTDVQKIWAEADHIRMVVSVDE